MRTHPRIGRTKWTPALRAGRAHAWSGGQLGEYLRHSFHWTCADRWFGCEVLTSIVLLALAHVYRWADGPVLP